MARLDATTVDQVFTYHKPREEQLPKYHAVREAGKAFCQVLLENIPECADRTAATRMIREAVMTANAAIALDGLI